MADILEEIAGYARQRVEAALAHVSREEVQRKALETPKGGFGFEKALKAPKSGGIAFICECKKASPSKGLIAPDFEPLKIAEDYEQAGADSISVLTEPKYFLGKTEYLKEISAAVSIPCLRKDFIVDEYMIYSARILGASAVLLICSILDEKTLEKYLKVCDSLGLSALTEAHSEAEIKKALNAGAKIIGVNNRNLKDFSVDTGNASRLRAFVPDDVVFVAESGIKTAQDVKDLKNAGVNALLIGETLMRAENKPEALKKLKELVV